MTNAETGRTLDTRVMMPGLFSSESSFAYEELLDRLPLSVDLKSATATMADKTVLITGAGGSIGSSLCRRLTDLRPGHLILLDKSEENLYQIDLELRAAHSGVRVTPILGDILEQVLLERLFDAYYPQVVFHAAAYKHVPLMEMNPFAALQNNCLGTYSLARSVTRRPAQLVMLSTDKAVNPASIMGASKRAAELILLRMNLPQSPLITIRLGNVFGTRGSVVPRFAEQIRRRQPVTVTHPDVSRYFLAPNEAVNFILAATSLAGGGEILVPDVGDPIRIVDLAEKMIQRAGLVPGDDLSIRFTGLRPGEKLAEQLFANHEIADRIDEYDVFRITGSGNPDVEIDRWVGELRDILQGNDTGALIEKTREIVPEYQPGRQLLDHAASRATRPQRTVP